MEFSPAELALMKTLGIPVSKPEEYKIIKAVVTCKLCKTITIQYFRMIKQPDNAWIKQCEIDVVEKGTYVEEFRTTVDICYACRSVLGDKDKVNLIDMIIKLVKRR